MVPSLVLMKLEPMVWDSLKAQETGCSVLIFGDVFIFPANIIGL